MNISNELEATLQVLILQNRKIEAIKKLRDATGCSLKEAKDHIDSYPDDPEQMPVQAPPTPAQGPLLIDNELLMLLAQGRKLEAIKLYKDTTGQDLASCKAYIDKLELSGSANSVPGKDKRQTSIDEVLQQQGSTQPTSGYFIATACYDNYDAPDVWLLRQYRDERLLNTPYGRAFVKAYYFISPSIAKVISRSPSVRAVIIRFLLEPVVRAVLK